jgi:hypothetical protein
MLLRVSVLGDGTVPLLSKLSKTHGKSQFIAAMLSIVAQQLHGDQWRLEFEQQVLIELVGYLIALG